MNFNLTIFKNGTKKILENGKKYWKSPGNLSDNVGTTNDRCMLTCVVGHERSRSPSKGRDHTVSPPGRSDEGEIRDDGMSPISDGGLEDTQVRLI